MLVVFCSFLQKEHTLLKTNTNRNKSIMIRIIISLKLNSHSRLLLLALNVQCTSGGGGALDSHLDGGVPLGGENLTLSQTARPIISCVNGDDRKIIPCPAARPRHRQYGSAPPPRVRFQLHSCLTTFFQLSRHKITVTLSLLFAEIITCRAEARPSSTAGRVR